MQGVASQYESTRTLLSMIETTARGWASRGAAEGDSGHHFGGAGGERRVGGDGGPRTVPDPGASGEERLLHRRALTTLLMADTLRHAERSVPYYQRLFRERRFGADVFRNLEDLRSIPVMTRRDVRLHYRELIDPDIEVGGVRSTGGTTIVGEDSSDRARFRMLIPYSHEEIGFIGRLRGALNPPRADGRKRMRLLVTFPQRRLSSTPRLQEDHITVTAPLALDFPRYFNRYDYFDHVAATLFSRFDVPGITACFTDVTFCPGFLLRLLTEEAQRRKVNLADAPVERVLVAGDQVSVTELAAFESIWQRPIVPTYGYSESFGFAIGCPVHRDRFHFDVLQHIEVLDPDTHETVPVGCDGLLVTWTLFPFQIAMPLLRYAVGDLVQVFDETCDCGAVGPTVKYVGRTGHCVDLRPCLEPATGTRRFLGPGDIVAILDSLGAFPKAIMYKFRTDAEHHPEGKLTLTLTTEAAPSLLERRSEIGERIRDAIAAQDPGWAMAIESGRLDFRLELRDVGERQDYFFLGT